MARRLVISFVVALTAFGWGWRVSAAELPVVGTGDGMDILRALAAAFTADNPDTIVLIPPSIHSGGGLAAVAADTEVLARIARPLNESEAASGIVAVPVFRLPSAIIAHSTVGVDELTSADVADIFAGRVTNWQEVGGNDVRIRVVRREEPDSTLSALRESMPHWQGLEITDKSKVAVTTQDAIDTVRTVEGTIGFAPFTKMMEGEVVVLKIDGEYPTDPAYPSAVLLSFAYKPSTITEEAEGFVDFVQSEKGRRLLTHMGGVPVQN